MFTPSPRRSLPRTTTSPTCTPIRNWRRRCSGSPALAFGTLSCTATAHWTASTALGNSASTLSPAVLAILPPWSRISLSITSRAAARARKVPASSWLIRREYPATSAAKIAASRRSTLCAFGGCTSPPLPLGNGAPGAAGVQAGGFRQGGDVPRWLRPGVKTSLLSAGILLGACTPAVLRARRDRHQSAARQERRRDLADRA